MGCFRTTPIGFLMAEGGSQPAKAIVRSHEARFCMQILGRPLPPTLTHLNEVFTIAETIWHLLMRMADLCGMTKVEPMALWQFTEPQVSTITMEPAKEPSATVQQWEMLGTECFWTNASYLKGHMGVVVVRLSEGKFQAHEFYLGKSTEVFDAELHALYEALHGTRQLLDTGYTFRKVSVFCDTQAALLHLQTDDECCGQCIGRWISWEEQELWSQKVSVEY
jgi:hypothetical protein